MSAAGLTPEREALLRRYARGEVSWREMQALGFADYVAVLGGLGELGLRPPIAPEDGPNAQSRARGREILREALRVRG